MQSEYSSPLLASSPQQQRQQRKKGPHYWRWVWWISLGLIFFGSLTILLYIALNQKNLCPESMKAIPKLHSEHYACIDLYEAPNIKAHFPLVMFTYEQALSWCQSRAKRLCYDDEWTASCEDYPSHNYTYPYGNIWEPARCNDNKTWIEYNQTILDWFPLEAANDGITSLEEMYEAASKTGGEKAIQAIDHLQHLYQGSAAGIKSDCISSNGVYDLTGNVEEWTTRRDGGEKLFHGNLKGRYWSESRGCIRNLTAHGDLFRFYEIGFRCCIDR